MELVYLCLQKIRIFLGVGYSRGLLPELPLSLVVQLIGLNYAVLNQAAEAGGPAVTDTTFMTITNIIRRKVR